MFAVALFAFFLPFISAQGTDPAACNDEIKVKPVTLEKGGIPYTKLAVTNDVPITISFDVPTLVEIRDLDWKLNGHPIDVDENEEKSAVYWRRTPEAVLLVIRVPKAQYIGNWEMFLEDRMGGKMNRSCQLRSPPMVQRFFESFRSTEGYELKVVCKSASMPPPDAVRWFKVEGSGNEITLNHVLETEMTYINYDTLVFTKVKMSDSGFYVCNTSTIAGGLFDSSLAEVKIKSRFAALWPFIGILAELIILLVTIIIYERHKASKRKAEALNASLLNSPVSSSGDAKSHH